MRDGVALVLRSSVVETFTESASSRRQIEAALDALGVGVWNLEHSSGGCHTFTLWLDNGSGDYIMVSDAHGPISGDGDADQFLSGGVCVGFYASDQWEHITHGEGVYFYEGYHEGVDRENAIVDAVGRVFAAVGFVPGVDGIDWERVAAAVLSGVCDSCGGAGVTSWNGSEFPCRSCEHQRAAAQWVRPMV